MILMRRCANKRMFSGYAVVDRPFRLRRAMLYMQGYDTKKMNKVRTLDPAVDSVCLDMEDGVAVNKKIESRDGIVEALSNIDFGSSERLVRINAVGSGLEEDDLAAILKAPVLPDGIVLPKVETPEHLRWVGDAIDAVSNVGDIRLVGIVESVAGILNLSEICKAHHRLDGLIFGADDYAADVGAIRSEDGHEIEFVRNLLLLHAAAHSLQAMDMVCIELNNEDRLARESRRGFELGYQGKQIIHPRHIHTVQQAYSPSKDAIDFARDVIEAHNDHQKHGKGAFAFGGNMIDMPTVKLHERILTKAKLAGLL